MPGVAMTDEMADEAVSIAVSLVSDADTELSKRDFLAALQSALTERFGDGMGELQAREVLARANFSGVLTSSPRLTIIVPEKPMLSFGVLLTAEELEYAVGLAEEILDAQHGRMPSHSFYTAMDERLGGSKYGIYIDQVSQIIRRGEILDRLYVSADFWVERPNLDMDAWRKFYFPNGVTPIE